MNKISIKFLFCTLKEKELENLKEHLKNIYSSQLDIAYLYLDISKAYDFRKNQYLADIIMGEAKKLKKDPKEKWLLVVDVDLYASGLNFIFGQADIRSGIGIISLTRLKPEFYGQKPNEKLFLERILKEATHELGHLFYLPHCENPKCVMAFSNSILDTDRKDKQLCEGCKNILKIYTELKVQK
ncbi:MAG: peptidase zinc-dependent [Thermodesulfobacterium geofontis]|uniref:Peptidase zinc-dependent n=1 Tax=Thermodesulfobacterium geofontis TaxID=1295609 RepID=A0A2N7Q8I2_9BACT|nr:MAG: peptidase zinc-dependent [Thermodesulfobacterium geofontis]PMP94548.1 MAG: peptidase zinc-dependent [Thermodesulfobacterium geofontis]